MLRSRLRVTPHPPCVDAVSSSEGKAKQNFHAVVGRERSGCAIYYKTVSWFGVDLGKGRTLSPAAYTLRHGREDGTDALRTWDLQVATPCPLAPPESSLFFCLAGALCARRSTHSSLTQDPDALESDRPRVRGKKGQRNRVFENSAAAPPRF